MLFRVLSKLKFRNIPRNQGGRYFPYQNLKRTLKGRNSKLLEIGAKIVMQFLTYTEANIKIQNKPFFSSLPSNRRKLLGN